MSLVFIWDVNLKRGAFPPVSLGIKRLLIFSLLLSIMLWIQVLSTKQNSLGRDKLNKVQNQSLHWMGCSAPGSDMYKYWRVYSRSSVLQKLNYCSREENLSLMKRSFRLEWRQHHQEKAFESKCEKKLMVWVGSGLCGDNPWSVSWWCKFSTRKFIKIRQGC